MMVKREAKTGATCWLWCRFASITYIPRTKIKDFIPLTWSEHFASSVSVHLSHSTRGQKQQPRVSRRAGRRCWEGEEDRRSSGCRLHSHHPLPAGAGGHTHLLEVHTHTHTRIKHSHTHPETMFPGHCTDIQIPLCHRNCFQPANFYADESASPKVISAPSTPMLLATGITHTLTGTRWTFNYRDDIQHRDKCLLLAPDGHEPLTVKQFVKHVMELHTTNTFSKEFEVRWNVYTTKGGMKCSESSVRYVFI